MELGIYEQIINKLFEVKLDGLNHQEFFIGKRAITKNNVMDFVFIKKATKSECINKMDSLFNGKANIMIDYLWKITRDLENSSSDSEYSEKKINKNIRERSRSRSYERKNKFNYSKYQTNMFQNGFYPPTMRYNFPMMANNPYYGNISSFMIPNPALIQK